MKPSFKLLFLILALASFALADLSDETPCEHSRYQKAHAAKVLDIKENFPPVTGDKTRNLASTTYPQFRIYANYENLLKTSGSSYTSYVQNDLAPAVISYFQAAMKVKYPVIGSLKLSSSITTLCDMATPSALKNGVSADYAILFTSRVEDSNVVASSRYCYLASGSKRPLIASTNFNRNMFKVAGTDVILHEKNTYLLFHEMMHTFGFSSSLYGYFLDADGKPLSDHVKSAKIGGITHTVLDVPALTDRLRTFHGCSTLPGAIMEDDGGSGTDDSHFEKKFYMYETMATGSMSGKRISELSLAVLEASGWYVVDYSYAEPYFFGQGEGCNFINGVCSSTTAAFSEFCTGSSRGCAVMGHSGGSCMTDDKTDGCKYVNPSNSYHCQSSSAADNARLESVEVYGRTANSKCFTGTLNTRSSTSLTSFCFAYSCSGEGTSTQLEIKLGSKSVICKKEGALSVSGFYGTVNCPDPLTFCQTVGKQYCPRSCMARGKCVNNKCVCNSGFAGIDCALRA